MYKEAYNYLFNFFIQINNPNKKQALGIVIVMCNSKTKNCKGVDIWNFYKMFMFAFYNVYHKTF